MKKFLGILLMIFPALAMATGGSLSFAPPPSDYSVVFLGNIFGIVDGVLHGNGSQIMGTMFGVFNAAVLALGGIVITYTLMVSTVNTAHEGQMLGQKWSSMWVPVRATLGLALLIPKASGYCMMQIFVMWVVVQGVGAADKVWASALSYLNRGGAIVQQQINPITSLMGGNSNIANGASTILSGQVCMAGLQQILTQRRQALLNAGSKGLGECATSSNGSYMATSQSMQEFCSTSVPSFIDSVNAVAVQNANPKLPTFNAPMPNFPALSPYSALNGICGNIQWDAFSSSSINSVTSNIQGLSESEIETSKMSRAIAIQQMYMDLASVAQIMVNNDPQITPQNAGVTSSNTGGISVFSGASSTSAANNPATPFAQQPFGVPYLTAGSPCTSPDPTCTTWGPGGSEQANNTNAPLFAGTEFQGAISDYNAIMLPTLNLVAQANSNGTANALRAFISQANQSGWIMAGSYFFDLAYINSANMSTGGASSGQTPTDSQSGLQNSTFDTSSALGAFDTGSPTGCSNTFTLLCTWMGGATGAQAVSNVMALITAPGTPLPTPNVQPTGHDAIAGQDASTVFGFINNSVLVNLPNQPGVTPTNFVMKIIPTFHVPKLELPKPSFECGRLFMLCLGRLMGEVFYYVIIKVLFMWILNMVMQIVNYVIMAFLSLPLLGMAQIFQYGVSFLQQPNVNPVIALANMGVNYINFSNDLWIMLIDLSITTAMIPVLGVFIFALISLAMPLLMAWMGTMLAVGFITAYYIPFLPYMIFTFGSIGWLMAVIEAMVAAPIVALGITHPEGEGPFGKGEQAIMILMNVFLRPALMIIGYIAGIILSYVSVWVINAGFANVVTFVQGDPSTGSGFYWKGTTMITTPTNQTQQATGIGYAGWAGIYGFFFSILIYTTMYLVVVQKAFSLIATLPDKVLRWIGGTPEQVGTEAMQWAEEPKKQVETAGAATQKAQGAMSKQLGGGAMKGLASMDERGAGVSATPSPE
jgi:defect-in-organelle-trafficking protein DotA